MGLVTEPPNGYNLKPSSMTRKASASSKETRQTLAAEWLVPPVGGARQFRNRQDDCLDAFRHALLDLLADDVAVQRLTQQLGAIPAAESIATTTEAATTTPAVPGHDPSRPGADESPSSKRSTNNENRHQRVVLVSALVVVVLAAAAGITVWRLGDQGSAAGANGASNGGASLPTTPWVSPTGAPISGTLYGEQGDNKNGSITVTDPHHPYVTGVTIDYMEQIKVSCKVYAVPPGWDSVYPDGYWYRIASAPWNNKYYAIANTFLNGDNPNGPTEHNTDPTVPTC
jgi:hypothetical protein